MPPSPARVRFAPSPTGRFHIGGARTALYNYLLARQTGGQFLLRIEDTDRKRNTPEALEELKAALRWLGLDWDEGPDVGGPYGPYLQSERKQPYLEAAQELVERGHAYRCFCSPERLKEVRESRQKQKLPPRYDGTCRALDPKDAAGRAASETSVIRFKTPREGRTTVTDLLRGEIVVENAVLDDFILVKSDGFALYHLAAMVDDHHMKITHVFRGEEWLGTFPLHALIIRALGWQEPIWCHLSVFLKPSGKGKMSKRDAGSEQSIFVLGLRELGFVPEAVNNWIGLMGASFGSDDEVLSLQQMIERFSLEHLNPSPARVNFDKLDHFNGLYLRKTPDAELARLILPYFEQAGLKADERVLEQLAPIIRERIVTLDDAVDIAGFVFRPDPQPDAAQLTGKDLDAATSAAHVDRVLSAIAAEADFRGPGLDQGLRKVAEELGLKPGVLFGILRVAVTGQSVSPPLFETMAILGREVVVRRLERAAAILRATAGTAPPAVT